MRKSLLIGIVIIGGSIMGGGYYYTYHQAEYQVQEKIAFLKKTFPQYEITYKDYRIHVLSRSVTFHDLVVRDKKRVLKAQKLNVSVFGNSKCGHIKAGYIHFTSNEQKDMTFALDVDHLDVDHLTFNHALSDVFIMQNDKLQQIIFSNINFDRLNVRNYKFHLVIKGKLDNNFSIDFLQTKNYGLNRQTTIKVDAYRNVMTGNINKSDIFKHIEIKNINLAEITKAKEQFFQQRLNGNLKDLPPIYMLPLTQLTTASFDRLLIDDAQIDYKVSDYSPFGFHMNFKHYRMSDYGVKRKTTQSMDGVDFSWVYEKLLIDGKINHVQLDDVPIVDILQVLMSFGDQNSFKSIQKNILSKFSVGLFRVDNFGLIIKEQFASVGQPIKGDIKFDHYQMSDIGTGKKLNISLTQMSGDLFDSGNGYHVSLEKYDMKQFDLFGLIEFYSKNSGSSHRPIELFPHETAIDHFNYGLLNVKDDPNAIKIDNLKSTTSILANGDIDTVLSWKNFAFPIEKHSAVSGLSAFGYNRLTTSANIQAKYSLKDWEWTFSNGTLNIDDLGKAKIDLVVRGGTYYNIIGYQLVSMTLFLRSEGIIQKLINLEAQKQHIMDFEAVNFWTSKLELASKNATSTQEKKWNEVIDWVFRDQQPRKEYRKPLWIKINAHPDNPVDMNILNDPNFMKFLEAIQANISMVRGHY